MNVKFSEEKESRILVTGCEQREVQIQSDVFGDTLAIVSSIGSITPGCHFPRGSAVLIRTKFMDLDFESRAFVAILG